MEFSVCRPSPPNTYSYVPKETRIQQENLYEITLTDALKTLILQQLLEKY